jgi:hypothetical protein
VATKLLLPLGLIPFLAISGCNTLAPKVPNYQLPQCARNLNIVSNEGSSQIKYACDRERFEIEPFMTGFESQGLKTCRATANLLWQPHPQRAGQCYMNGAMVDEKLAVFSSFFVESPCGDEHVADANSKAEVRIEMVFQLFDPKGQNSQSTMREFCPVSR